VPGDERSGCRRWFRLRRALPPGFGFFEVNIRKTALFTSNTLFYPYTLEI
jgi:hypothetical protein